ncbi:hypothetical protein RA180_19010 [Aeromonas salmonicida]|uniref:hypothetical protein n=1 Tax=Aeromonas salmonicida TaxID=645 RepID=UPI002796A898|nr:hypothetical protein [Aeromonas salmonicida]MDQ1886087.1 hypothetical protein [Aeromonas salmonicida]
MTMITPTAPPMSPEAAIARLRAYIEEFIALELTHKLDAQLASLARSGVLDLDNWDGANLVLHRTVTTALLEAAAERVIWHSHRRLYQRDINRLKQWL